MKIGDFLNNIKDESRPIIIAFFLCFICFIVLSAVWVIHNFFGMDLLGQFFSAVALLILFLLAGKIFFNTNYSGLFKEIKLSKCDLLDNLLITMFFSSVFGLITIFIYHIGFMINPDKTISISYFIENITPNDNYIINNNLDLLAFFIILGIGVAAEEIFFRYVSYKIFVKKKGDVKIFIILTSIVFGCYHDLNLSPRFFATIVTSIFLSIIYVMTKSVIYAFISHVLWDWSTPVTEVFMEYFKNINTSIHTVQCIIIEIMIICLLILLIIYSYFKRGHILPLNIRNKIYSIKNNMDIY